MPVLTVAVFCLVLIGLPFGSNATPVDTGTNFQPVETEFVAPVVLERQFVPVASSVPSVPEPLVRPVRPPVSLQKSTQPLGVLNTHSNFPAFIDGSLTRLTAADGGQYDPRLQRAGKRWALSSAFRAQVGADPWALAGIGFPEIETHGSKVQSAYKPYRAVVDWKLVDKEQGTWKPVPAVYCMGLSTQQIAERAAGHERQILSLAIEHGISASLVKAVITKESCFDTQAVSSAGAEGLMQLMPDTARWLKVTDRTDVTQNLSAGVRYLAELRKRFGSDELALAAYNAGPGNVERHGGIPPFAETQQYVVSVMAKYRRYAATSRFENQRVSN